MNAAEIEKLYEKREFSRIVEELKEKINAGTQQHIARLFIRSANEAGFDLSETKIDEELMKETDYIYNRFVHADESSGKKHAEELLGSVLANGRVEMLEEMLLIYLEKHGDYPIFDRYYEFLINHQQKPVVLKYLESVSSEGNILYTILRAKILNEDCSKSIENAEKDTAFIREAYTAFLKNDGIDMSSFEYFKKAITFRSGVFVILDNEIYRLMKYDALTKLFTLKDKFERTKSIDIKNLALKTNPIESDDFRVYKFFSPEKARDMEVCQLLTMVLKYKQTAIDRNQLKDELAHIFGAEAGKWISKNRKGFESCENVDIMYEKTERYIYSENASKDIVGKASKIKEAEKLTEFIRKNTAARCLTSDEMQGLLKVAMSCKGPGKYEAAFAATGDAALASEVKETETALKIKDGEFKKHVALNMLSSGKPVDEVMQILDTMEPDQIEYVYRETDGNAKEEILKAAERSLRLKKELNFLMWYTKHHFSEGLLEFSDDYIAERLIDIADEMVSMKTGTEFIQFVRRVLFSGKTLKFLSIIEKSSDESARRLFKTFEKAGFLTDYQRDEIRSEVFKKHPDFRDTKTEEYILSTKEAILEKQRYLDDLVSEQIPAMSLVIKEAAALGDLAENSEYKFAREKYGLLSKEAEKLKRELGMSQPIDFSSVDGSKVEAGVRVRLFDHDSREEKEYTVLGPLDVKFEKNIISYKSPLIQKIFGMERGARIENIEIIGIDKIK